MMGRARDKGGGEPGAPLYKDSILDELAGSANVAQFISFDPMLSQRFSRIHGYPPNHRFESITSALSALLKASPERLVNIRSYHPVDPKNRPFLKRLDRIEDVEEKLRGLAATGLYTIVNETVDEHDGGVSGVVLGEVLEFAPDDTPRCVDAPDVAILPRVAGLRLLESVYGFKPALDYEPRWRVEFSIHPLRRGYRNDHTMVWERHEDDPSGLSPAARWPNRFSRMIGDKVFGLLVADTLGLPVPATTVISRRVAPFRFGRATGTREYWIRTCPVEQVPGRFTTRRGWLDPFQLLQDEDPTGSMLASILAQEGVGGTYSGALVIGADGQPIIEGVGGAGDRFMLGVAAPEAVPRDVHGRVINTYERAQQLLGPVRMEWVDDGNETWVVQMHLGMTTAQGRTIFQGHAATYHDFDVREGLERLYQFIEHIRDSGDGIVLRGNIGVTSHMGDVLRKARIPSRIEPL
jgi:hypothetical protein